MPPNSVSLSRVGSTTPPNLVFQTDLGV